MTEADQASGPVIQHLATPSLARRLSCWFYEGVLLFGVVFISGYLFSALSQTRHALDNRHGLQAFVFLVMGLYFTWFWHKGQTLAMKTWHLRLVDQHGLSISQQRALARYVLSWVWLLPPLALAQWLGFSPLQGIGACAVWVVCWALLSRFQQDQQYWHDQWAGTRLIDVRPVMTQKSSAIHTNNSA
jgi:uncharacterized RDD family membrane protein YckC